MLRKHCDTAGTQVADRLTDCAPHTSQRRYSSSVRSSRREAARWVERKGGGVEGVAEGV